MCTCCLADIEAFVGVLAVCSIVEIAVSVGSLKLMAIVAMECQDWLSRYPSLKAEASPPPWATCSDCASVAVKLATEEIWERPTATLVSSSASRYATLASTIHL